MPSVYDHFEEIYSESFKDAKQNKDELLELEVRGSRPMVLKVGFGKIMIMP